MKLLEQETPGDKFRRLTQSGESFAPPTASPTPLQPQFELSPATPHQPDNPISHLPPQIQADFSFSPMGRLVGIAEVPIEQVPGKLKEAQAREDSLTALQTEIFNLTASLRNQEWPINANTVPPKPPSSASPTIINGQLQELPGNLIREQYEANLNAYTTALAIKQAVLPTLSTNIAGKTPLGGLLGDAAARLTEQGLIVYLNNPSNPSSVPDKVIPHDQIGKRFQIYVEPRPLGLDTIKRVVSRVFNKRIDPPGNVAIKDNESGQVWHLCQTSSPDGWTDSITNAAKALAQEASSRNTLITLHQQYPQVFGELVPELPAKAPEAAK